MPFQVKAVFIVHLLHINETVTVHYQNNLLRSVLLVHRYCAILNTNERGEIVRNETYRIRRRERKHMYFCAQR